MAGMEKTPLQRAIEVCGSPAELARRVGVTAQAVSQWRQIPARRVRKVSEVTGIPREQLRPDLAAIFEAA